MDEQKPRSLVQKMFQNEKGEISFRKAGTVFAALGAFLIATPEIAAIAVAGKAVAAIGGMLMALGQFEKNDRTQ